MFAVGRANENAPGLVQLGRGGNALAEGGKEAGDISRVRELHWHHPIPCPGAPRLALGNEVGPGMPDLSAA